MIPTINGIKLVALVGTPLAIKYLFKCAILFAQIGVNIYSGGVSSILSTMLVVKSARQVLEEFV